MSHVHEGPLAAYNSLVDNHLRGYFANTRMRRHLRRAGLITKHGNVVTESTYRLNMSRKAHKQQVKDMLAQAIVHKTLDLERTRQSEIKKKLEEIAKIQLVQRVRASLNRPGDEDVLPLLGPRLKRPGSSPARQKQKGHRLGHSSRSPHLRPKSAPGVRADSRLSQVSLEEEGDVLYLDDDGRPIEPYRTEHGGDQNVDSRHLHSLDTTALRKYAMMMARMEEGHGMTSPYLMPQVPLPPRTPLGSSRTPRSTRRIHSVSPKRPVTTDARIGRLHRPETAKSHEGELQMLCKVRMHYYGSALHLPHEQMDPTQEVVIEQQHCGGNTLSVFKERLKPGSDFEFVSYRHRGYPFSLTLYLNGQMDSRVSTCCEYRHRKGAKIGGKQGHFSLVGVDGAVPCYKCQVAKGVILRNKAPPKRKKHPAYHPTEEVVVVACEDKMHKKAEMVNEDEKDGHSAEGTKSIIVPVENDTQKEKNAVMSTSQSEMYKDDFEDSKSDSSKSSGSSRSSRSSKSSSKSSRSRSSSSGSSSASGKNSGMDSDYTCPGKAVKQEKVGSPTTEVTALTLHKSAVDQKGDESHDEWSEKNYPLSVASMLSSRSSSLSSVTKEIVNKKTPKKVERGKETYAKAEDKINQRKDFKSSETSDQYQSYKTKNPNDDNAKDNQETHFLTEENYVRKKKRRKRRLQPTKLGVNTRDKDKVGESESTQNLRLEIVDLRQMTTKDSSHITGPDIDQISETRSVIKQTIQKDNAETKNDMKKIVKNILDDGRKKLKNLRKTEARTNSKALKEQASSGIAATVDNIIDSPTYKYVPHPPLTPFTPTPPHSVCGVDLSSLSSAAESFSMGSSSDESQSDTCPKVQKKHMGRPTCKTFDVCQDGGKQSLMKQDNINIEYIFPSKTERRQKTMESGESIIKDKMGEEDSKSLIKVERPIIIPKISVAAKPDRETSCGTELEMIEGVEPATSDFLLDRFYILRGTDSAGKDVAFTAEQPEEHMAKEATEETSSDNYAVYDSYSEICLDTNISKSERDARVEDHCKIDAEDTNMLLVADKNLSKTERAEAIPILIISASEDTGCSENRHKTKSCCKRAEECVDNYHTFEKESNTSDVKFEPVLTPETVDVSTHETCKDLPRNQQQPQVNGSGDARDSYEIQKTDYGSKEKSAAESMSKMETRKAESKVHNNEAKENMKGVERIVPSNSQTCSSIKIVCSAPDDVIGYDKEDMTKCHITICEAKRLSAEFHQDDGTVVLNHLNNVTRKNKETSFQLPCDGTEAGVTRFSGGCYEIQEGKGFSQEEILQKRKSSCLLVPITAHDLKLSDSWVHHEGIKLSDGYNHLPQTHTYVVKDSTDSISTLELPGNEESSLENVLHDKVKVKKEPEAKQELQQQNAGTKVAMDSEIMKLEKAYSETRQETTVIENIETEMGVNQDGMIQQQSSFTVPSNESASSPLESTMLNQVHKNNGDFRRLVNRSTSYRISSKSLQTDNYVPERLLSNDVGNSSEIMVEQWNINHSISPFLPADFEDEEQELMQCQRLLMEAEEWTTNNSSNPILPTAFRKIETEQQERLPVSRHDADPTVLSGATFSRSCLSPDLPGDLYVIHESEYETSDLEQSDEFSDDGKERVEETVYQTDGAALPAARPAYSITGNTVTVDVEVGENIIFNNTGFNASKSGEKLYGVQPHSDAPPSILVTYPEETEMEKAEGKMHDLALTLKEKRSYINSSGIDDLDPSSDSIVGNTESFIEIIQEEEKDKGAYSIPVDILL